MAQGQRHRPCRGRASEDIVNSNAAGITVLGSSSSIPRPGRACSSYLLRFGGRAVVFDFGTGAYANLVRYMPAKELDAICISHLHSDHFFDLVPLRYALRYGPERRAEPLPVYVPPGGKAMLEGLGAFISGEGEAFFDGTLALHEYDPAETLLAAGAEIRFAAVPHYIDSFAMRCTVPEGVIAYSADTAFDQRVVDIATEADLFICEATLGPIGVENGDRGHCSAADAGKMAAAARVGQLALTHYGIEQDPQALLAAAAAQFKGQIDVLDDHRQLPVHHPILR